MKIERPRGTRDFLPEDMWKRRFTENAIMEVLNSYNYEEILIPTFEHLELFEIKSGEEIKKHMYVFEDKGKRNLCLRPEATASVCRMFVENLRNRQLPIRLYYSCPMFRYDEPQKGRYREFWQIGVELIGSKSSESDAEVIALAIDILKKLGLKFKLEISHLGIIRGLLNDLGISKDNQSMIFSYIDKGDLENIKKIMKSDIFFKLIDIRRKRDALELAHSMLDGHENSINALKELQKILRLLDFSEIEYEVNLGIVRGLEYYTGMVFEISVPNLGAQNQICGGGRYDELIELLGGPKTPAVGFAFGFDRIIEAMEMQKIEILSKNPDLLIAPANDSVRDAAWKLTMKLRKNLVEKRIDIDLMNRKLEKILEYASRIGVKNVIIVGEKDLSKNKVALRNMKTGEQKLVEIDEIAKNID